MVNSLSQTKRREKPDNNYSFFFSVFRFRFTLSVCCVGERRQRRTGKPGKAGGSPHLRGGDDYKDISLAIFFGIVVVKNTTFVLVNYIFFGINYVV